MAYAKNTTVPVSKTRMEIEELVVRTYGATEFTSGWSEGQAAIQFKVKDRRIRFLLRLPSDDEAVSATTYEGPGKRQAPSSWKEKETQRRWRCLLLSIRAKFEAVQSGISSFDREFFSDIVTDNDMTVFDRMTLTGDGRVKLLTAKE